MPPGTISERIAVHHLSRLPGRSRPCCLTVWSLAIASYRPRLRYAAEWRHRQASVRAQFDQVLVGIAEVDRKRIAASARASRRAGLDSYAGVAQRFDDR